MSDPASHGSTEYDVVVVGGAFAAASTAVLLLRQRPQTRILMVERSERFGSKVGEATVEVSALFLEQVLALEDHLKASHLPKHGLRYWLTDGPHRRLDEMTEIGPVCEPALPSYQLDRAALDQHLLDLAREEGAEVARPARVTGVDHGWPRSEVRLRLADGSERSVSCRWVVDGSGRFAYLARRMGLQRRNDHHTTSAAWSRWRGVADLDGPVWGARLPKVAAVRRYATNHFSGYGWWCWMIPLADGRTSVGLVWDRRLFEPPGSGDVRDRAEAFVRSQPGLRELLADAEPDPEDRHAYVHLAYRSERYAGRGWALVGDAASFIDPYYSPGLDHAAMSVSATVRLLAAELDGRLDGDREDASGLDRELARHNAEFERSYDRWFDALYRNKYELFGDAELMASAFLIETSLYYLGVVTPAYRRRESLANPVFGLDIHQAKSAYLTARTISRRMVALARARRRLGIYGRRNAGHRISMRSLNLGRGALPALFLGLRLWLRAELETLAARLRLLPSHRPADQPSRAAAR